MDIKDYASKLRDSKLVSGHKSCVGCGFPAIMRMITAGTDKKLVAGLGTGCVSVTTTTAPHYSWTIPTIHNAFANLAATVAGMETAYRVLKRKGKIKEEIRFVAFGGDGGCYSDDTEVFTKDGFKNIKKLKVGEELWSANPFSNELELVKIEKMFAYKVNGKMIRVKTRFMDYLITPDHHVPMWFKGKWKFIHASDLLKRYKTQFIRKFDWKGKKKNWYVLQKVKPIKGQKVYKKFPLKLWLNFLGWFISEGCLYKSKSGYLIRIYQSNNKNRKEILKLLKKLKVGAFECNRSVDFQSKQIYTLLETEIGKYSKQRKIPEWVLELDKSYLKELYKTLMQGDGSISIQKGRKNPHLRYITSSKKLMNSFVELILKLGWNCRVTKMKNGIFIIGVNTLHLKHYIYSKRRLYEKHGTKQVREEYYNGWVYCPQLIKNHTIIIKRNNKICLNGNSYDIGLQSLSGALERNHKMVYVCYNNEAYMNTGNQKSSATPYGTDTSTTPEGKLHHGKEFFRKDLTRIVAAHDIPYVAQACTYNFADLIMKAQKAFEADGPSFINVLSPCVLFWRIETGLGPKLLKLAMDTCYWPLYEVENKVYKLNYKPAKKLPITEFLKLQGRFKHLFKPENKRIIDKLQKHIDDKWNDLLRLCKE